ncbi:MAG: DUF1266 domain-containing protein [Parahaliea sp.]
MRHKSPFIYSTLKALIFLPLATLAGCGSEKILTKNDIANVNQDHQMVYVWSMNAILNYENSTSDFIFSGEPKRPENQAAYKGALQQWWSINNKLQFKNTMRSLENGEMHHKAFMHAYEGFFEFSEADFQENLTANPEYNAIDKLVWANREAFKEKGLLAWDLVRAIGILGWGYQAGYASKEEAYAYCLRIAQKVQANFSSHAEMADNYIAGYLYWSMDEGAYEERKKIMNTILDNKHSAWNVFPFDYSLDKKAD